MSTVCCRKTLWSVAFTFNCMSKNWNKHKILIDSVHEKLLAKFMEIKNDEQKSITMLSVFDRSTKGEKPAEGPWQSHSNDLSQWKPQQIALSKDKWVSWQILLPPFSSSRLGGVHHGPLLLFKPFSYWNRSPPRWDSREGRGVDMSIIFSRWHNNAKCRSSSSTKSKWFVQLSGNLQNSKVVCNQRFFALWKRPRYVRPFNDTFEGGI